MTTTFLKTLSLCVVAGIAATIVSFSQTSEPTPKVAPAAQTMPVAHTITSKDGRTIDVTILSKSDTAIKAARADGKEFEITLDKLSDADKAFIAGLAAPDSKAVKKPTVLVFGNDEFCDMLSNLGFDVTKMRLYTSDKKYTEGNRLRKYPKVEWSDALQRKMLDEDAAEERRKTIVTDPLSRTDAFDIVWIHEFHNSRTEGGDQTQLDVTAYRAAHKGLLVIGTPKQFGLQRYVEKYVKPGEKTKYDTEGNVNYVRVTDNFIFYEFGTPSKSKKGLTKDEVLLQIKEELEKLMK